LLDDAEYREEQRRGLLEVRQQLGTPGAAGRVAEMISGLAG
jgi:hypothetical protein